MNPSAQRERQEARLTKRQQRLLVLIDYRRQHDIPTVQRDLAEALGVRRESLNKLLARTRERLRNSGHELVMPPRQRAGRAAVGALGGEC